jgi:hypothetical protein
VEGSLWCINDEIWSEGRRGGRKGGAGFVGHYQLTTGSRAGREEVQTRDARLGEEDDRMRDPHMLSSFCFHRDQPRKISAQSSFWFSARRSPGHPPLAAQGAKP